MSQYNSINLSRRHVCHASNRIELLNGEKKGDPMRDIFVVLSKKEAELKRLQSEIELLRNAARLLAEEGEIAKRVAAVPEKGLAVVGDVPQREARTAAAGLKQFP